MSASNPPSSTAKRGHRRLRPRCRRCIKLRRNCNGQKPKCDICKTTVDCVWPEGNPSRRELEEREAAELEQNQSQSEYQDSSLVSAGTSSDPTVGESGISAAKNEGAAVKRKRDGAQITTTVQMHDGSGLIGSPAEPARRTRNTASRGGRGRSRGGTSRARGGGTGLAPRSSTPTPSSTAQSESIPMYQNSSEILDHNAALDRIGRQLAQSLLTSLPVHPYSYPDLRVHSSDIETDTGIGVLAGLPDFSAFTDTESYPQPQGQAQAQLHSHPSTAVMTTTVNTNAVSCTATDNRTNNEYAIDLHEVKRIGYEDVKDVLKAVDPEMVGYFL